MFVEADWWVDGSWFKSFQEEDTMKALFVLLSLVSVVAIASADITTSMNSSAPWVRTIDGQPAYVFRLRINLTPGDDWTNASIFFQQIHPFLTWYQSPSNDGNPPDPSLFGTYPNSQWTSYYTSPADYPTSSYDGGIVGITSISEGGWTLDTDWYDSVTGPLGASGAVIGQFTLRSSFGSWTGFVGSATGSVGSAQQGSVPFSYDLYVPEPTTVVLLALGGLSLMRRR
jgi:hypothetical protein